MSLLLRTLAALSTGLLALAFMGCTARIRGPAIPNVIKPTYTDQDFKADVAQYKSSLGTPVVAKAIRNRIVHSVMADVEYFYRDYETRLFVDRGKFNIGGDVLELGLAVSSTLSHGERTKTILSTLVGGVAGTRISVDKNLFRERTVEAIISSMEARRTKIEARILQQLSKEIDDYPLEAALKDLREYFFAGTLTGGLTELQQQAATTALANQKELDRLKLVVLPSKEELAAATAINLALGKMFAEREFGPLITFLNAMGKSVDGNTQADVLEKTYRELAQAILTDSELRRKFMEEAKKAKLIE